jgi:hypothetical protein
VPQIDTPLLLDVLLVLVVLLFVPFGVRRGVAKEAMVSAAILLGALLAARFADAWASIVSSWTGLDLSTSTFVTSLVLLLGTPILLGYGGGIALGPTRPGMLSRLTGGVLAAINGVFLLSTILSWIDRDLGGTAPLDEGVVSSVLIRRADEILLYVTLGLIALTVLGWCVRIVRSRREPSRAEVAAGAPMRQRPIGAGASADFGKHEPMQDQGLPTGRFVPSLDTTSPLPAAGAAIWSSRGQASTANGQGAPHVANSTRAHANGAPASNDDQTVWMAWSGAAESGQSSPPWPVTTARGVTDDERCAVCRAQVGPRDVFCPECGATL